MLMATLFLQSGYIGIYNQRLAITLGLTTLFFALTIFASCRSCVTLLDRVGLKNLTGSGAYKTLYRYHSCYWWTSWFVFSLHLITSVMHTGLPAAYDPDAYLHWYVLWSEFAGFISLSVVVCSCRSLASLLSLFGKNPLVIRWYLLFYRYHSYYWLLFLLLVAAHFAFRYVHAGIWPH